MERERDGWWMEGGREGRCEGYMDGGREGGTDGLMEGERDEREGWMEGWWMQ